MPTSSAVPCTTRRWRRVGAAAVLAALVLAALGAGPPPVVARDDASSGDEVTLTPPARRTLDGTARVQLAVGPDAPGDVTVTWALHDVQRTADGRVAAGPAASDGSAPAGTRLRPGEVGSFTVTIAPDGPPALLVATVRAAGSPDTGAAPTPAPAPTTLATLLLPGAPPDRVTATLVLRDGELVGEVDSDRPALVSVRLRGEDTTTLPERLVLPGDPLVVVGAPAGWPLPSLLTVTAETGAVATADTGTAGITAVALALLLVAGAGIAGSARHRRTPERGSAARELA